MALRKASIRKRAARGFSLIEILVVMAMFTMVAGLGLFVSMDAFRGYTFRSERDTVVSLLYKARSQAVSNMCFGAGCTGGRAHGVHFDSVNKRYVIFQGYTYAGRDASVDDVTLFRNNASSVAGLTDIIFSPLAATTTANPSAVSTVTITDQGGHASVITIGKEGRITWTN